MSELKKSNTGIFASWLFLLLPLMWIAGLHPNDIARIICGLTVISLLIPRVREYFKTPLNLGTVHLKILLAFIIIYPVIVSVHHIYRVHLGGEGINFAYFANVLNNFPQYKALMLTLNKDEPYNHLLHHFSPVFYLPAGLTLLGIPGHLSLVIFEFLIMISVIIIFRKILIFLGYSKSLQYIFIVLLLSNYSLRHAFNWSIEDEFFALPFIVLSYYFFLKKKTGLIVLSLLLCCTVKESMFLFSAAFCLMIVLINMREKSEFKKNNILFASLGILSIVLFALYIWGQPLLLNKTYDHLSKAGNVNNLWDLNIIKDKLWYLVILLLPFLYFPVFFRKGYLLNIPVLPFLMLSMVSAIPNLYNPMDYYSAVPTTIFAVTTVVGLKKFNPDYLTHMKSGLAVILICIAFFLSGWKPTKVIYEPIGDKFVTVKNFDAIPHSSIVASSESLIPLLTGFKEVKTFEKEKLDSLNFNYLVIREKEKDVLPEKLPAGLIKDEKLSTAELWIFKK